MNIKTNLFLLSATFVILIITIGFIMFQTFVRINRDVEESHSVNKIIKDISELDIVTYEYLMHHETRMVQQWWLKYISLAKLLKGMGREEMHPEYLPVLETIITNYEALGSLFLRLQDNLAKREKMIKGNRPRSEIDITIALENRLVAQSLVRSQKITSDAFKLSAMIEQTLLRTQQKANAIILFSIIGFVVFSSCISFLTARAIMMPINELTKGVEIIGKGNLEHEIIVKGKNELGQLASSFNKMTKDLQVITVSRDELEKEIAERKQAEEALQESEERLRSTVSSLDDLLFVLDKNGIFADYDQPTKKSELYVPPELFIGKSYKEVLPPHVVKPLENAINAVIATNLVQQFDYPMEIANKQLWYNAKLSMRKDAAGEFSGVTIVARNITDRKQAEQALRDAQEQLISKEKLAVLGQLAGGVGHELRNPLGVITNALYFLKMVLPESDETTQEYLGIIESEARNAEKIVSDLLDFSRVKTLKKEEIAVSELVTEVLEKKLTPENITVTTKIPMDTPQVFIDPGQVSQVLSNIFSNAYHAMPGGGNLTISSKPDKGYVNLSIADTGFGISPKNLKKIFEPLFTTRAKGIGLGLAVSKSLLEANGGNFHVESKEDEGSTFTITLPTKEVIS